MKPKSISSENTFEENKTDMNFLMSEAGKAYQKKLLLN